MLQEIPAVTRELVNYLFDENKVSSSLVSTFSFRAPVILVAWQKYSASSTELDDPAYLNNVRQEIPLEDCKLSCVFAIELVATLIFCCYV